MTYVIADTQKEGKFWALSYLSLDEKFEVISTVRQVIGKNIERDDCVYIVTENVELWKYLTPALNGCRVTSCNDWIIKKWLKRNVMAPMDGK